MAFGFATLTPTYEFYVTAQLLAVQRPRNL